MASTGAAAWAKYYQGKGDVQTRMKKDGPAYDANDVSKYLGPIPSGTPVLVIRSNSYESKPVIRFEKNGHEFMARVPFDNIAKPGVKASGAASLKPQAFNVQDKKYALQEYKRTIIESIETRMDLQDHVKEYLDLLFKYYGGAKGLRGKIVDHFTEFQNDLPLNDINKDFGEVLGPAAIQSLQLLQPKGILVPTSTQVYVPWRPNEPLMDYALIIGDKQYTISAKSGTTTNVVKPEDIIQLIMKNPAKAKKWQNTPEFNLLRILQSNSALNGPIKAVSVIHPNLITAGAADQVNGNNTNIALFGKFIQQNAYLKNRKTPTINEIMYECEKLIQQETKVGKLNMNKIFSDAISGQVIYVKFELDKSGVGHWDVIASDNIKAANSKRIYMRSKNGYTRASDKMGIQV